MASVLDICNLALAQIGHKVVISSLSEQSVEAEYCALFWPQVRDQAIADPGHNWSFAVNRLTLSDVTSTYPPPEEFEYTYGWPSECLKFIGVRYPEATDDTVNNRVRLGASSGTRLIYTNVEDAVGVYVKRVTDPTLFQPMLVTALEFLMAARLASPLVKGNSGLQMMAAFYDQGMQLLKKAQAADANQEQMDKTTDPTQYKASWLSARGASSVNETKILRDT